MAKALPNLLTIINLLCGSAAIANLFQGALHTTLILALIALVADACDGLAARLLNAQSEIGKQLDSLADMVSFGLLPGAVVFHWMNDTCELGMPSWLAFAGFLITAGSALRLAKFNLDSRQTDVFFGLPTPAATVLILGILMLQVTDHPWSAHIPCNRAFLIGLIVLLPLLMLSDLRLWSMKKIAGGNWIIPVVFLVLFGALLLIIGAAAISSLVLIYILAGILNLIFKFY